MISRQLDFSKSNTTEFIKRQADDDLPAVWVVPVEGEAVGEPGVDVVQAHLLAGRIGQRLKSVDHQVSDYCVV